MSDRLIRTRKPLSEFTEEELMEKVRNIREDRKIKRYTSRAMTPKNQRSRSNKLTVSLSKLSPEELQRLKEELGI